MGVEAKPCELRWACIRGLHRTSAAAARPRPAAPHQVYLVSKGRLRALHRGIGIVVRRRARAPLAGPRQLQPHRQAQLGWHALRGGRAGVQGGNGGWLSRLRARPPCCSPARHRTHAAAGR